MSIVARRSLPHFFVIDHSMRVLHRSEGIDPRLCAAAALENLAEILREARLSGTSVVEFLDESTLFRIMPLRAGLAGCWIIFVDSFGHRTSRLGSGKKFGLTKRESEFLPLLLAGYTTTEMATKLFLAESTVADHIKSILRKTGTKKRSEAIARIYDLNDEDPQFNGR